MGTRKLSMMAAITALVLTGCETGSNDSSGVAVANYAGTYRNDGKPMAFQHTGAAVTSMSVIQEGEKLLATDNNGVNFRGSIGAQGSDGHSPFNMVGATTEGAEVTLVGSFSRDSSRAIMSGNWIEPTLQSTFKGFSGDAPAPAPTTTPAPQQSATPPPVGGEPQSVDAINAPASFSVSSCEFKDDGDVGGWPITTIMRKVTVSGGQITMVYDDVSWPVSSDVNGNCWLVLDRGGWEASTFDYLRPNQETKSVGEAASKRGIHSGETVGVFVSTLARDDRRNGDERSQIYWLTWP